jgi:uncharacterized protein
MAMKIAILCGVLAASLGCGTSARARLYVLEPLPRAVEAPAPADRATLAVGPLTIPEYLDRPQIVTRGAPGEIAAAEFDRWAEPLKQGLARAIAENLAILLAKDKIPVFVIPGAGSADYRLAIAVTRLDGALPGEAVLDATWSIIDADGATVVPAARAHLGTPIPEDGGYRDLVEAQSTLAADLCRAVATAAKGLAKPNAARASR